MFDVHLPPNGRILEADDQDMLEEERRLFYVALTRAKDELYLTYVHAIWQVDEGKEKSLTQSIRVCAIWMLGS
jgi:superfamily I DNA/RNA helicase